VGKEDLLCRMPGKPKVAISDRRFILRVGFCGGRGKDRGNELFIVSRC